jgi:hypothetical protein
LRFNSLTACACRAGRQKVVHIPPSPIDAKQAVQTFAATAGGSAVVLHVRDLAVLALDVAAAAKADSEVNVWSEAMPGAPSAFDSHACSFDESAAKADAEVNVWSEAMPGAPCAFASHASSFDASPAQADEGVSVWSEAMPGAQPDGDDVLSVQ